MNTGKKSLFILWVFLTLLFLLGLVACGESVSISTEPAKDIIGKWESIDGTHFLEFTDNGEVRSIRKSASITLDTTSNVIFLDDRHIVATWDLANLESCEVQIRGDQMTLIAEDGEITRFTRIE